MHFVSKFLLESKIFMVVLFKYIYSCYTGPISFVGVLPRAPSLVETNNARKVFEKNVYKNAVYYCFTTPDRKNMDAIPLSRRRMVMVNPS